MPRERDLLNAVRDAAARSPSLPFVSASMCVLVWFATAQGGFGATVWYPGALLILALLVVVLLVVPTRPPSKLACFSASCLGAYAAWSYLSITWAAQKADAWDGAGRAALYALTFALFALWEWRGRPAVAVLGGYVMAIGALGLIELLRAAEATSPANFFIAGRLSAPLGYQNADVALWFSAFWPAVVLGSRRGASIPARAAFVATAVVLGALALMGQSRGWMFIAPVATVIFTLLSPARVRFAGALGFVLVAVGAISSPLLDVYDSARGPHFAAAVATAARAVVLAGVGAAIISALATAYFRGAGASRSSAALEALRRIRPGRALGLGLAALALLTAAAFFVAVKGRPLTTVQHAWRDFKTKPTPNGGSTRFGQSLGSNRYDFWRVAVGQFEQHPLTGIGADNFQQAYLLHRRSDEAPRYPHSVELRALSQTGLIGSLILVGGVGAALVASYRAARARGPGGSAAAVGATFFFGYWLLHGSLDWFWEFPALGAAAFAMLGLGVGLEPRAGAAPRRLLARRAGTSLALAGSLALALSLAALWLGEREVSRAIAIWPSDAGGAYDRLARASALNPLSARPKLVAGSIAARLGQYQRAEGYMRESLARDPGDAYAHLELGALVAQRGDRRAGTALVKRATQLDPRDDIARGVLERLRRGRPVNLAAVNREISARSVASGR
ncbi:MAG: hypothetical protein NVS2B6_09590 [Thermoleophilaceae bacterium]